MDPDRQADIAALDSTLTTVERVLDVEGLRGRIEKLEQEASDPNLWDDQARAQKVDGIHVLSEQSTDRGCQHAAGGNENQEQQAEDRQPFAPEAVQHAPKATWSAHVSSMRGSSRA